MNKVDKIFKWISIALLFLTTVPILSFFIYLYKPLEVFIAVLFASSFISAFLIPFGDLILMSIFFIKLFSKNKIKKNDEQIMSNLFVIICFTFVSFFCFIFLFYIFISDKINT